MYSKQEASQLRQEFWTTIGKYMTPVLSAEGEKINWLNYKTGEKNISFNMNAGNKSASISIELTHADAAIRNLYYEQFVTLKKALHQSLAEEWEWVAEATNDNGEKSSKIYTELQVVSIFNKADWPTLISFFKPRIVSLDEFWSNAKYAFEALK